MEETHAISRVSLFIGIIQLNTFDSEINIIIEDDGIGFDTSLDYEGLGMRSLISRVKHLNGRIEIDSRIGEGTSITINIPY